MATEYIRYDLLVQDALRGVVRTVLIDAQNGLPGEHHFYITFDTRADAVRLSDRMRAQYPEEMTVVLQHQFWDLMVDEAGFEVGLAFGGVTERLTVPFASIRRFVDPSVPFEVRFEDVEAEGTETQDSAKESASTTPAATPAAPGSEHKGARPSPGLAAVTPTAPSEPSASAPDGGPGKPSGSGEVVRLDRFRKK